MPRPSYSSGERTAKDKLKDAFWDALSEAAYTDTGVRDLCRRAEVNKNTFYYHYRSVDDLADEAIGEALPRELGELLMCGGGGAGVDIPTFMAGPEMSKRLAHVETLLSDNATALHSAARGRLMAIWCDLLGMAVLNESQERLMLFVASGVIGSVQGKRLSEIPLTISELVASPAIRGCILEMMSWSR